MAKLSLSYSRIRRNLQPAAKMSNPFNGSKLGKRGGRFRPANLRIDGHEIDDRPSALRKGLPLRPANPVSQSKVTVGAATLFDYTDSEESCPELPQLTRKSLTKKHGLKIFPRQLEVEPIKTKQLDQATYKATGEIKMVETTDNRLVWKSDRTLLRQNKPEKLESIDFKRQTSRSKRIRIEREEPAVIEVDQPNDYNGPKF